MNKEFLRHLLSQPEGLKLEFKRELFEINHTNTNVSDHQWNEFIKDILSLSNGNAAAAYETAYLIIGAANKLEPDKRRELFDIDPGTLESKQILQKVNAVCHPRLESLICETVVLDEKRILVISIPPDSHVREIIKDLVVAPGKKYLRSTTFIRNGEEINIGGFEEIKAIKAAKNSGKLLVSLQAFLVKYRANPHFVGRQTDLEKLHALLQPDSLDVIPPVLIVGLGGIGKTQLAVQYAFSHRSDYPGGVYWIESSINWIDPFSTLARVLGLPTSDTPEHDIAEREAYAAFQYLNDRPDALLIVDNLEQPGYLNHSFGGLSPAALQCRILCTTRRGDPTYTFSQLSIGELPEADALQLLLCAPSRRPLLKEFLADPNSFQPEIQSARCICKMLGGLPLALALAAAYLGRYPDISLSGYQERIEQEGALPVVDKGLSFGGDLPTRHSTSVSATLRTQWAALVDPIARITVQAAALMPEATSIDRATLSLLTGLPENQASGYPTELGEALTTLAEFSLLTNVDARQIQLHPLVRDFILTTLEDRTAFSTACALRLAEALWHPGRLTNEIGSRGIFAILSDLRLSYRFLSPPPIFPESLPINRSVTLSEELAILYRLLSLEAHNLADWEPEKEPAYCLQQLRNRAVELGWEKLAYQFEQSLELNNFSYLRLKRPVGGLSPAVQRMLLGAWDPADKMFIHQSPSNESRVTAVSQGGAVITWDLGTGKELNFINIDPPVLFCEFSKNGNWLFVHDPSVEPKGYLQVWEVSSGKELFTLPGDEPILSSGTYRSLEIAVSKNQTFVAAICLDHRIRIWNLTSRTLLFTLTDRTSFSSLEFTPDSRQLVTSSEDGMIRVWDLKTGKESISFHAHQGWISKVLITPNGRRVISASFDGWISINDLVSGVELCRLGDGKWPYLSIALAPNGQKLISTSAYIITLWDMTTGSELYSWVDLNGSELRSLAMLLNGEGFVTAYRDGSILVWDLNVKAETTINGHINSVSSIAITPDGYRAVSASSDYKIKLWDPQEGEDLTALEGHSEAVRQVVINSSGDRAASVSSDGTLKIWDLNFGSEIVSSILPEKNNFLSLSPDQLTVRIISYPDMARCVNFETGQIIREFNLPHRENQEDQTRLIDFAGGGSWVVALEEGDSIQVWEIETGRLLNRFQRNDPPNSHMPRACVLSDSYHLLFSAVSNNLESLLKKNYIVDLRTGEIQIVQTSIHAGLLYSNLEKSLAITARYLNNLVLQDLFTGEQLSRVSGNAGIRSCAISDDFSLLVAGDSLGGVYFYDWVRPNSPEDTLGEE